MSIVSDFIDGMFKKLYIEQNEIKYLTTDIKRWQEGCNIWKS